MITLLNIIRVIYSHIIVNRYKDIELDSDVIEKIIESHFTSNLTDYEINVWIRYLKSIKKCEDWNLYQMYREWLYHTIFYKRHLFIDRTDYVDYEEKQTFKTYIRRIIGNCVW